MENPIKMDDLRVPLFSETLFWIYAGLCLRWVIVLKLSLAYLESTNLICRSYRCPGVVGIFPCKSIGHDMLNQQDILYGPISRSFCGPFTFIHPVSLGKNGFTHEASEAAGCIRRVPKYNETISQDL